MQFLPNSNQDQKAMLAAIGVDSIDQLFADIAVEKKYPNLTFNTPGLSEIQVQQQMSQKGQKNTDLKPFLGAGSYQHYIPAVVDSIVSRGEFYTAYTPYQPEISQGTLQAIFEYQSMICELTGMDVSNASMYDGASSLAEAMLMATRIKRNKTILVSQAINPNYRQVLNTYAKANSIDLITIPVCNGQTDQNALSKALEKQTAAVLIQCPNYFGCIEDLTKIRELATQSLLITSTTESLSWATLKPFSEFGVDIVTGDAQSFGNASNFGGPSLGVMATKKAFLRQLPGRIVGKTTDSDGKEGFVLTLSTREQHIRREKATSNICSNQGLCALAAAIYIATLGPKIKQLADYNHQLANYFYSSLIKIQGIQAVFKSSFFNEFLIQIDSKLYPKISKILGGHMINKEYPSFKDTYLLAVTETTPKSVLDPIIKQIKIASKESISSDLGFHVKKNDENITQIERASYVVK